MIGGARAVIAKMALLATLALLGCAPRSPTITEPPVVTIEWFVDGSAPPGGDGSRRAPWRDLPSVAPVGVVRLASGLYRGPMVVPAGARLATTGQAVVYREGDGVVLEVRGGALEGVSVQGGAIGVQVEGSAGFERVHFSGQRQASVQVGSGARADFRECTFDSRMAEARAIAAPAGARLFVERSQFSGRFSRGIEMAGASAMLSHVQFDGVRTALHAMDATVQVRGLRATGGTGPAVFAVRGTLRAEDVEVTGHEYALQLGAKASAEVDRLTSTGALQAAVALVGAQASLRVVRVENSGPLGAVQSLESTLTLTDVKVRRARSLGVFVRQGRARIEALDVEGVVGEGFDEGRASLGDGLHVRDAVVEGGGWNVRDVQGAALFATHATVNTSWLQARRCGVSAVVAERESTVTIGGLSVQGARQGGVFAVEGASLRIERYQATGASPVSWVDCAHEASASISELEGDAPPANACTQIGSVKPTASGR